MCAGRHVYPRTVVSVSYHYIYPTKRTGLLQSEPHHYIIEHYLVLSMIQIVALNNNHSLTHYSICVPIKFKRMESLEK
jgi:hypothetical protein